MGDVIELAKQAGAELDARGNGSYEDICFTVDELKRFAALVGNAKLEEAAQKCNGRLGGALQNADWWGGFKSARNQCVAIIQSLKG